MKHTEEEIKTLILGGILTARKYETSLLGDSDHGDNLDMISSTGDVELMKAQLLNYYNSQLTKSKM